MEQRPTPDERRRRRQLTEIERLLAAGHRGRAGGLMMEHLARFPADAEAVGRLLAAHPGPSGRPPAEGGP